MVDIYNLSISSVCASVLPFQGTSCSCPAKIILFYVCVCAFWYRAHMCVCVCLFNTQLLHSLLWDRTRALWVNVHLTRRCEVPRCSSLGLSLLRRMTGLCQHNIFLFAGLCVYESITASELMKEHFSVRCMKELCLHTQYPRVSYLLTVRSELRNMLNNFNDKI